MGGCSASFTVEWFPQCEQEVVCRPPYSHPYQLHPGAKPAWEMGPTCAAWRTALSRLPGPGSLRTFSPTPTPSSPGLRPFRGGSRGAALWKGNGTGGEGCARGERSPRGAFAASGAPNPLPPPVWGLTLQLQPPARVEDEWRREAVCPTPALFPQSYSQCHECSAVLINGTAGLNPSPHASPLPTPRPHPGNTTSGFAPTHKPRPAFQTRDCSYLLNLRGKGLEGNGIESVTGCNKLKSPLLVLWRPKLEKTRPVS